MTDATIIHLIIMVVSFTMTIFNYKVADSQRSKGKDYLFKAMMIGFWGALGMQQILYIID
jgi:hypothetical protein